MDFVRDVVVLVTTSFGRLRKCIGSLTCRYWNRSPIKTMRLWIRLTARTSAKFRWPIRVSRSLKVMRTWNLWATLYACKIKPQWLLLKFLQLHFPFELLSLCSLFNYFLGVVQNCCLNYIFRWGLLWYKRGKNNLRVAIRTMLRRIRIVKRNTSLMFRLNLNFNNVVAIAFKYKWTSFCYINF